MKNMASKKVLSLGTNNICYAHSQNDLEIIKKAYTNTFKLIYDIVFENKKDDYKSIKPIFEVRKND